MPGFIKLSTNTNCLNKTRRYVKDCPEQTESTSWQLFEGLVDDGAIQTLLSEYSMKGFAINASPFVGTTRSNDNSYGGNVVVIDLDDGIEVEKILATPTYQLYGMFYYPSCSSGVVSTKKNVDGRERGRVAFRCEREFKTDTSLDENGFKPSTDRRNLERIAVTKFLADNLCSDLGIAKLEDNCHRAVSQLWYGNSGEGTIYFEIRNDDGTITVDGGSYPCSTDRRTFINEDGCLPAVDMDRHVDAYISSHPEIFEPRKQKSDEDVSREVEIARWILNHDLLSEEQLMDREIAIKSVVATCRTLCDSLLEDFIETMQRVDDGHPWRLEHQIRSAWERFQQDYDRSVGSLIILADEASPGWREDSPFFTGTRKTNVLPLSEAFSLMRSIPQSNIIL